MMQEFVQQTKDNIAEQLQDVHTAVPGKIVSVEASSGTCTVLPVMKKKASNGSFIDYPKISGVPIVFPQGGGQGASVVFPVEAGDGCLLIISEQSLDYWMYGRMTDSDLRFDITNAICIPGLFQQMPDTFAEACSSSAVIVQAESTKLKITPNGAELVGNLKVDGKLTAKEVISEGNVSATGDVSGTNVSGKTDVTAGGISLKSHKHTSSDPGTDSSGPH